MSQTVFGYVCRRASNAARSFSLSPEFSTQSISLRHPSGLRGFSLSWLLRTSYSEMVAGGRVSCCGSDLTVALRALRALRISSGGWVTSPAGVGSATIYATNVVGCNAAHDDHNGHPTSHGCGTKQKIESCRPPYFVIPQRTPRYSTSIHDLYFCRDRSNV